MNRTLTGVTTSLLLLAGIALVPRVSLAQPFHGGMAGGHVSGSGQPFVSNGFPSHPPVSNPFPTHPPLVTRPRVPPLFASHPFFPRHFLHPFVPFGVSAPSVFVYAPSGASDGPAVYYDQAVYSSQPIYNQPVYYEPPVAYDSPVNR